MITVPDVKRKIRRSGLGNGFFDAGEQNKLLMRTDQLRLRAKILHSIEPHSNDIHKATFPVKVT